MFFLLAIVFTALCWCAYMESPKRAHERSMIRCVKSCTRRQSNYTKTWPAPSYRWYY